ncbi:CHAD domain-containing protein [Brachybacterium vulturis]|uniref:CHAD domain-containing protein n=1 Tax=Brachybacterium vulturis TaxID=2017484 RepID=UPI0012FD8514|nr:CHAD domain-containing protein [Brachybacterium vulturis]
MSHEDALTAYVHEHAERAAQGLLRIERAGEDELERELTVEAVHETRTSLRRLRATLRTFPESFAHAPVAATTTDRDLRFVARTLSELRDTDVLAQDLLAQVEALPASLVLGPVREELADALAQRRRTAVAHVAARHGRARWRGAVDQLGSWQQDPPRLVEREPLRLLEGVRDEVRARLRSADGEPHALHSARKAAKRWRYAAELLLPVEPGAAAHYDAATTVHVQLGLMQDAVVATGFLLEHAHAGGARGHNAFTTGLLHQRAQQRIQDIAAQAPHLL